LYRVMETHCTGETGKNLGDMVPRTGVEPVRPLTGKRRILSNSIRSASGVLPAWIQLAAAGFPQG